MRLCLFREKLKREIKELEELTEGDRILSDRIQPTIYCIAAMLRKISEELPKLNDKIENVKVIEISHENKWRVPPKNPKNIKLKHLLNSTLHYVNLSPSYYSALVTEVEVSRTRYITILSDEDMKKRKLSGREIHIKNFIMVAKRIVEDDELIIDCLLPCAIEHLGEVIDSNSDDSFLEMRTRDILINFFDIAYEIKEDNWLDGKITIFRQKNRNLENEEIEYKVLLKKIDHEWFFSHFRQFQFYQEHGKVLKLVGEKRTREDHKLERIMIRAEDLLNALCAMECQRR